MCHLILGSSPPLLDALPFTRVTDAGMVLSSTKEKPGHHAPGSVHHHWLCPVLYIWQEEGVATVFNWHWVG